MIYRKLGRPIEILLVDDNPGDVDLAREALTDGRILNNLTVAQDGVEAMSILRGQVETTYRPDIILLDLNLPKMDGRQVLSEIKDDPALRLIPVVILTTSQSEQDILKSYSLHANCYITKPVDLNQFMDVVKSIESFWFSIVTLPAV